MVWYSHLFKNFPQFVVIHTVKGFGIVNKAEVDIHSTSCEISGWMNHKLESRLLGEISISSDIQMTPPLWQKVKKNKEPLDERGE